MRTDIWYDSKGAGKIHACRWTPEGEIRAVVQILHGIAEFVERYDAFAGYIPGLPAKECYPPAFPYTVQGYGAGYAVPRG